MFNVCQTVTIRLQVGFPRGKLRIGDTEQPAQHEHPEGTATGLGMDTRLRKFIQPAPARNAVHRHLLYSVRQGLRAAVHRGPQLDSLRR
jgi:hypothetical protein